MPAHPWPGLLPALLTPPPPSPVPCRLAGQRAQHQLHHHSGQRGAPWRHYRRHRAAPAVCQRAPGGDQCQCGPGRDGQHRRPRALDHPVSLECHTRARQRRHVHGPGHTSHRVPACGVLLGRPAGGARFSVAASSIPAPRCMQQPAPCSAALAAQPRRPPPRPWAPGVVFRCLQWCHAKAGSCPAAAHDWPLAGWLAAGGGQHGHPRHSQQAILGRRGRHRGDIGCHHHTRWVAAARTPLWLGLGACMAAGPSPVASNCTSSRPLQPVLQPPEP